MCGLAGIVHWDRQPIDQADLARMRSALRHRGPDEQREDSPERGVGLVHARLKVIDLSQKARQPMSNEDGSVWLVYNGEVYNFQELRQELTGLGFSFHSQSDTEVVLRAYEAWGKEAVSRLDGMFAFALWDGKKRELLLARDRAGKKPLFYWTDNRCLIFGSEIKALLTHAHVPCEVDEKAIPFLLAMGYPPTGQTCYRSIRQVPPASFVRFRQDANPFVHRYWDLDFTPQVPPPEERQSCRQVRELMKQAVSRRLVADVPLGAFLSGGVDSTIVVGLMRELLPHEQIRTFSIGFEGDPRFDETHYAKIASERFKTNHTVFTVSPQSFELLERLVRHHDQPFGDSSAIPTYLISQLARGHVTVALTGDGGDEAFAGYTRFAAACWSEKLPAWVRKAAEGLFEHLPVTCERSILARVKRFFRVASLPLPERYWRWISYGGGKNISRLSPSLEGWWRHTQGASLLSRLLYLNFKEYLPNDLLVKMDRCSMAHGLEVRSPFLDTRFMEYVAGLPDAYKLRGWRTKVLLKQAFRDLLPPAIEHRRKMGFGVPLGTWFRTSWREPLMDLLSPKSARLYRYVEESAVKTVIERHLAGREDAGHRLWIFLTLEVWLRQLAVPHHSVKTGEVLWRVSRV